jgi:hypothetical protein
MKKCPECSAEYDDKLVFCPKDGRTLHAASAARTRLCPECANSISLDARQCPYCKADIGASAEPQWPPPPEQPLQSSTTARRGISPAASAVLFMGIGAFVTGMFFLGARMYRGEPERIPEAPAQIESGEAGERMRLADVELKGAQAELKRVRQELDQRTQELAEYKARQEEIRKDYAGVQQRLADMKSKYEESQKDLAVTQERLAIANRQTERLAAAREQTPAPPPPRPAEPQRTAPPAPPSVPASNQPPPEPARRVAEPGTYETIRSTTVYDQPSGSSKAVSQIGRGTRVAVVRSVGEWLEVRSKHGNPPGYIRREDAMFIGGAN